MTDLPAIAAHVDEARLWDRIISLARHGATPDGGVCRLALTPEEIPARAELIALAREMGLSVATDPAGNLFFRWDGADPTLDPVMTGSHIDSQPTGGRFDGVYGVLAGFEAVAALRAAGITPRRSIVIVSWMNEEASRFAPGMMGSEAFAGMRPLAEILAVRDAAGVSVAQALAQVRAAFPDVPEIALGFPVHAFVEAHIEQGPLLERAGVPVGVVTGIQGSRRFRVTVTGAEAHAGTEPLRQRRDALLSAIDIVQALRAELDDPEDILRFTIGRFEIYPNAPSVVAARAYFSIDLRHPDWDSLMTAGDRVAPLVEAHRGRCAAEVAEIATSPSLHFQPHLVERLEVVADAIGTRRMRLFSAAGHDARQLHYLCPTAMVFVPCAGGISHSPAESCRPGDLAAGARVLAGAIAQLAA